MGATERLGTKPPIWVWGLVSALIVAIAVVGVWRPWTPPPATIAAGAGELPVAPPAPLDLPDDARVLILGDSWTWGQAAEPGQGYAYVIAELTGWTTVVDGIPGSGYLRPGKGGPEFGARMAGLDRDIDPDLIIVQGSINDRHLYPTGYREAVTNAWDTLSRIYSDVPIVILGPAPHILPLEQSVAAIDADLKDLAAQRGWWYISPVTENWITDADYLRVIDTSEVGRNHPSTEGHRYLAERLAASIAAITR